MIGPLVDRGKRPHAIKGNRMCDPAGAVFPARTAAASSKAAYLGRDEVVACKGKKKRCFACRVLKSPRLQHDYRLGGARGFGLGKSRPMTEAYEAGFILKEDALRIRKQPP